LRAAQSELLTQSGMTVRDMLTALPALPRSAELLAFEAG